MHTIEIPMATVSLNALQRMHFRARGRLQDQYCTIIRLTTSSLHRVKTKQFRQVWIERHGPRLLDYDNLVGGAKPLVDALQRCGLVWDDSPRYCRVTYSQRVVGKGRTKTLVSVI